MKTDFSTNAEALNWFWKGGTDNWALSYYALFSHIEILKRVSQSLENNAFYENKHPQNWQLVIKPCLYVDEYDFQILL